MPSEHHLRLLAKAALAELPDGWRVHRSRARWTANWGSGRCYFDRQLIAVPWPPTHPEIVACIAHEVAHAILHPTEDDIEHVQEYEAEMWSVRWLRARGVRVSLAFRIAARKHVRRAIDSDIKAGKEIRPTIRRWAARKLRGESP